MKYLKLRLTTLHTEERGDVPGWVLITLMTVGIVLAIWGLATPALTGLFERAMDQVGSSGL